MRQDAESSLALLERARQGDDDAINEFAARYLPRLQSWARDRLPVLGAGSRGHPGPCPGCRLSDI